MYQSLYNHIRDQSILPSRFNKDDIGSFLRLKDSGRTAIYKGLYLCNVSCARANNSVPLACGLFYFEIEVLKQEKKKGVIAIGFAHKDTSLSVLPGTNHISYAYHGNGLKFDGSAYGKQYGPKFTAKDIVGCGFDLISRSIFYTKNGEFIGFASHEVPSSVHLFPILGLHNNGDVVRANFGQSPFSYNIEKHMEELKAKVSNSIAQIDLSSSDEMLNSTFLKSMISFHLTHNQCYCATADELFGKVAGKDIIEEALVKNREGLTLDRVLSHTTLRNEKNMLKLKASVSNSISQFPFNFADEQFNSTLKSLVLAHLIHYCYYASAEKFAYITGKEYSEQEITTMENRKEIRGLVLDGRIEDAIETLQKRFPNFLRSHPSVHYLLKVHQFIELLGGCDPEVFSNGSFKAAACIIDDPKKPITSAQETTFIKKLIVLGRKLKEMSKNLQNVQKEIHVTTDALLTKALNAMMITCLPVNGLSELFEKSSREDIYRIVDSAVLQFLGRPLKSPLELVFACMVERLEEIGICAFATIDCPF